MSPLRYVFLSVLFFFLLFYTGAVELSMTILQVSDNDVTKISLSNYNESDEENQAFTQLLSMNKSVNFTIEIDDIPPSVAFLIVQIHSYIYNVSMYYAENSNTKRTGNFVTGTNIGLFVETYRAKTALIHVMNKNNFQVDGLVAVVAYNRFAPYPGGCNMEFEVEVSPFQKLIYDNATIIVDAQPASVPKIGNLQPPCEKFPLRHDAYRMYMLEQDFSNVTYFSAIANMLTVRDIKSNAYKIPASLYGSMMRRVYSLYPGTGSVYGMVARFTNHSSAYVPIVTYGCSPTSWSDSCNVLTTSYTKVLCAWGIFIGFFIAMRGHYCFRTSMFLLGMMLGGYVGYIISSAVENFNFEGTIGVATVFSIFMGLIWLLLWLTVNNPIPSLILTNLMLGSFFFYIFYFVMPVGVLYLEVDAYFWMLFIMFIVISFLISCMMPLIGNILTFTLVGAYITIFSIDCFIGSYLKYLIVNVIRRITVPNFHLAVIEPPFQDKEIMLTFLWTFLVIVGLYKQFASSYNRAPFPSPHNETTPLLG